MENLKPGANQKLSPGTIIVSQGSPGNSLIILHEGSVSIRFMADRSGGRNLENSFYGITLKGPAILGASSILTDTGNFYHALTETPCTVSVYAANKGSMQKIMQSKPQIAMHTLKTLIKEVSDLKEKYNKTYAYLKYLCNINYSLSLAFSKLQKDQFTEAKLKEIDENSHDKALNFARISVGSFLSKGQMVPEKADLGFFKKDYTSILGMDYQNEMSMDEEQLYYFEKLLSIDANILGAIAQRNPDFLVLTGEKISSQFKLLIDDIQDAYLKCIEYCDLLFTGQYSWLEKYSLQAELLVKSENKSPMMVSAGNFFTESVRIVQDQFQKLWAQNKYELNTVSINKINQYLTFARQDQAPTEATVQSTAPAGSANEIARNALQKILQYSELEAPKQAEFKELLKKFKEFANPMDSEGDAKKVKRALTNIYWVIYENCVIKYLKNKETLPRLIEVFLLTGLIDETLLTPEQVDFIFENVKRTDSKYGIHNALDWLEMIYNGEIPTSINELGVTFFEVLRQENRDAGWKRESDVPKNINSPEARVKFEIHNMLSPTVKLTSGTILNHLPILTQYHFIGAIDRTYISKQDLEKQIDKLLSIDFGAYHREVLYMDEKAGIQKEFIQTQVIPNMIMVPSIGNVYQFWQEREGNNRMSPGRLVCPVFATEDMFDMLLTATGAYRWELTKTILGPDWNNISSSSLTADYTDYVQFYKKNRDLSQEIKEKLAMEFKRFRDDRARFINDYHIWIKYESEGTQRLNKVIRKIMAKHIPFTKGIRENLLKLPNFQEIIQKSINIKKRKAIELEPRYKKYRSENNGILPEELQNTLKFYLMDY